MKRKQIFGFDYTNNEYMKIFMYLLVGGSAALLDALLYFLQAVVSQCCLFHADPDCPGGDDPGLCHVDAVSLHPLQPLRLRQRQPLSSRDGSVPGLPGQCHWPGLESPAHVAVHIAGYFRPESDGVENHGQCHRHRLELCIA